MNTYVNSIKILFEKWANERVVDIYPLSESGSNRKYYRISGTTKIAIGVFNPDINENRAYISFTDHFFKKKLKVPHVYAHQLMNNIYLIEDFGDTTLYTIAEKEISAGSLSNETFELFKEALKNLVRFQIKGGQGLDYSLCYPRDKFDKQSILWDLNYFKYYFLKLAKISFNEQKMEGDFNTFSRILLSADSEYFMYRDFQSRNIMVRDGKIFFIDYQGGRKGALQYDVASFIFQAKLNLSDKIREALLSFYLDELKKYIKVDARLFKKYYYSFVLIRILQTLGTYGFRGYYENKAHFLLSIPYAIKNLKWMVENNHLPKNIPELTRSINLILENESLNKIESKNEKQKLKVAINSFSYKEGIPKDFTGNGGGFVFDCRSLENPGRYPEYKNSTGKDSVVINFLNNKNDVKEFLNSVYRIADASVKTYIEKDFKNLMINFGCTGGQHRSVYCAENLARHLSQKFDIVIELNHSELLKKGFK